jgi:hypothetical protein
MRNVLATLVPALLAAATTVAVAAPVPDVQLFYIVPADQPIVPSYAPAISTAIDAVQDWFEGELDGKSFRTSSPAVRTVQAAQPASAFFPFFDALDIVLALTGQQLNDPLHRSIFYIDAPLESCCAWDGVALLPRHDLLGLTGQLPADDPTPPPRWVGGLAHELGHVFGLPHPPGCDQGLPDCASDALMWLGYRTWPDTFLTDAEKLQLGASPFFLPVVATPQPPPMLLLASGAVVLGVAIRRGRRRAGTAAGMRTSPALTWAARRRRGWRCALDGDPSSQDLGRADDG